MDSITPTTELDLSGDGFNVPGATWTITEADVSEKDDRQFAVLTFEAEVDGNTFAVTERYTLKHDNPKAVAAGRGGLKRVFLSALGRSTGALSELVGASVVADGLEDDNGFRRLRRIKAVA